MKSQLGFVLEVFLLSAVISVLIKYAGPYLPIAQTTTNVLIIVFSPTACLAIALLWRANKTKKNC
jgi:hypothetical protein